MRTTSKTILAVVCAFSALMGNAAAKTGEEALVAARAWLTGEAMIAPGISREPSTVETVALADGVLCHVVSLVDGGYIVLSAEEDIEPVLAFAVSGSFAAESAESPLRTLLKRDLSARTADLATVGANVKQRAFAAGATASATPRARWAKLLADCGQNVKQRAYSNGKTSVSDLRVAALVKSHWGQTTDTGYSNTGSPCYNLYTPNNCPCGCVATAMAQIMRYWSYPSSVSATARPCEVNGTPTQLSIEGGAYDWSAMPLDPAAGTTATQRSAIGKLTADCGVAMCASYWGTDAAGAYGGFAHEPLKKIFRYANAMSYCPDRVTLDEIRNTVYPSLDAGAPVLMSFSAGGGDLHAVVADGYGFVSSTPYVHLNVGWTSVSGSDLWYNLPNVTFSMGSSSASYSVIDAIVYNVFPERTGDVLSGRVTDEAGKPLSGVTVTAVENGKSVVLATATTTETGVYALVLPGGKKYDVTAGGTTLKAVALKQSVNPTSVDLVTGSFLPGKMACGNSWGNDFVLSDTPTPGPEPEPEPEPEEDDVPTLFTGDVPLTTETAQKAWTYNGYLLSDDRLVGSLQLNTAKADKSGNVKVKATLTEGASKTALTGTLAADAHGKVQLSGKGVSFVVRLGELGMTGTLNDDRHLLGARNTLGEKSSAETLNAFKGNWTAIFSIRREKDDAFVGYAPLSVSVGAKCAVKVSGTLPDGSKANGAAALIVDEYGEGHICVDVPLYSKKGSFKALLCLVPGAGVESRCIAEWNTQGAKSPYNTDMAVDFKTGASVAESVLEDGDYAVSVAADAFDADTVIDALPSGLPMTVSRGKITLPKAGKVTLDKKTGEVVIGGENASALKLAYTAKTGSLKGSFNVYRLESGKLKNYSAMVSGFVVGDEIYATADIKKLGISVPVEIR